jgi:hypothetical protein
VIALELRFVGLEDVHGVAPGTLAQGAQLGGQGKVHGLMVARSIGRGAARRGRWDGPCAPDATPGGYPAGAMTMIRISVMSSIAQRRPSRPRPESLTPP